MTTEVATVAPCTPNVLEIGPNLLTLLTAAVSLAATIFIAYRQHVVAATLAAKG
jgi:hypothetical protein